jgi:hypothetical protein
LDSRPFRSPTALAHQAARSCCGCGHVGDARAPSKRRVMSQPCLRIHRCRLDATSPLACAGRAPGRPRGRPRISPSAVLNSPQMCCPLRGKNTNGDRCRSGPSSLAARLRAVLEGFWCVPIGGTVTQHFLDRCDLGATSMSEFRPRGQLECCAG